MLEICATILVSVVFSGRTILKRIKTYLPNAKSENRLNGLAVMFIYRGIEITTEEVIDSSRKKNINMNYISNKI